MKSVIDQKNSSQKTSSELNSKFKAKFGLPACNFLVPIDLEDVEIGFSIYKNREKEGFKSLFRIYIENKKLEKVGDEKSIIVTVSYGKECDDGIIVSSSEFDKKISWPIDLSSKEEFSYDINSNKFYYKKSNRFYHKKIEIRGIDILKKVDQWHMKTTKTFLGFWLRTKIFFYHILLAYFFKLIFYLFASIQYLISGNKNKSIYGDISESEKHIQTTIPQDVSTNRSAPINLFGYFVDPWIAILYGIFNLTAFIIFYLSNYRPGWLVVLFKNNFLTLMYGIVTLGLFNTILPKLLKHNNIMIGILKRLQKYFYIFSSKKVKI